jgi:hypothetical protein
VAKNAKVLANDERFGKSETAEAQSKIKQNGFLYFFQKYQKY